MTETCLRRLSQLLKHYKHSQTYHVNLDDLELVFSTSRRNISNILRILDSYNWIHWEPGRGRGKASTLKVTVTIHQALYFTIRNEINNGSFDVISRLLEHYRSTAVSALSQALAEVSEENKDSNTLIVSQYPWVDELTPSLTYRFSELQVIRSLYDTLFTVDHYGQLKNHLACEYKNEGSCIYIWLRPDICCHDGLTLQAEDVVHSLNKLVTTDGPVQKLLQQVTRISFDNAKQAIRIDLKQPNNLFIYCLATANASITTRRQKSFKGRSITIGTGPFVLRHWDTNKIVLKKHHNYFAKKALLEQITLSHQGTELDQYISYNQETDDTECYMIQAFSFLARNRRAECSLSEQTWQRLFSFIESRRFEFAKANGLETMHILDDNSHNESVPQLEGTLVITHPKWTIDYLSKANQWIVDLIRQTGLHVEFVELTDASNPQLVKEQADLLFVEDVIEPPLTYGIYEWLLTGTGIRFALHSDEFEQHVNHVHDAVSDPTPEKRLEGILSELRDDTTILPLFWGQEKITRAKGVSGVQLRKSGYSDFYKLRVRAGQD
ncbi:ABC transporter substrate-binding protein [Vibrio sp. J2-4]|uniref:ABC transporter substrate-binding protein n=1 Tax=Vibrio sp. J2-4 TaxID=1507977 RepID=UPI001F168C22|nr:ABC transporter substrate-binding protein [Vibrio sp. J2-4]MCF7477224.1 ABC transporter substrate-binding protein [Vibrio sp. J2-4]